MQASATRSLPWTRKLYTAQDNALSWFIDMKYARIFQIVFWLMVVSLTMTNLVSAQVSPFSTPLPWQPPQKNMGVKVTSPLDGQKIKLGTSLVINGTSTDNSTANCQVSVIVNNVKPYQKAEATGTGGSKDYSKWIFHSMPNYATLKEGQNKITSKLVCLSHPTNLTKWYSVNVTGTP